ncbi:MAG: SMP-30/gluconolactonase/LRE family protein [Pseudomonadota bacterium]
MAQLIEIARGLAFPEGPVAMPDGSVVLVEIERGTLSRVHEDGRIDVIAECGGGPNGAALGPGGQFYVCNNGGFEWETADGFRRPTVQANDYIGGRIQIVDPDSGRVETLYDQCNGEALKGPNDIVFDSHGGFYFTDLGKTRARESDRGALYYAQADGSGIEEVAFPLERPNGVGLAPDEARVYIAETTTGRVLYWALEGPGVLRKPCNFFAPGDPCLLYSLGGLERLDSLAVDGDGNVCVATLVTGMITVISPESQLVREIPMPEFDPMVTNICFGGSDLRTAYITSSGLGRLYKTEWHCAGLPLSYLNTSA